MYPSHACWNALRPNSPTANKFNILINFPKLARPSMYYNFRFSSKHEIGHEITYLLRIHDAAITCTSIYYILCCTTRVLVSEKRTFVGHISPNPAAFKRIVIIVSKRNRAPRRGERMKTSVRNWIPVPTLFVPKLNELWIIDNYLPS